MPDEKHEVRIHIDQKEHHSPSPTTGADLYELGHVREGLVLYREVRGDQEDNLVRIDSPKIDLKEDAHFHSGEAPEKHYIIFVNTEPKIVDHDVLTFEELVKIAFPVLPTGNDPQFTVSFEHAKSDPHHGNLKAGGTVTVRKFGTSFDVDHTNRS
jgi:hypothetical protein